MHNWEPHLHWTFRQEHVLLPSLVLETPLDFALAALVVILICLLERFLTLCLEKRFAPGLTLKSKWRKALWRTCLYWAATFLRLCYMLTTMTFQLGIILIVVSSLSLGQFMIECWETGEARTRYNDDESGQPLAQSERDYHPLRSHPRSMRSKPEDIFIHPSNSTIAAADATSLQIEDSGYRKVNEETMIQRLPSGRIPGPDNEFTQPPQVLGRSRKTTSEAEGDTEPFLIGESISDEE
ncbi:hypothetical protein NP233_g4857 [Leucocoprinus birnbaumii]|uniref:Copper transporter n=1 Tax=Leucocoprinus birnbaumii TaxID=56174 RepID=A0AAD5VU00_9AGAR|nr:hypothetical protein NP233_g4857 [Leucocoprinus birnbaumii]